MGMEQLTARERLLLAEYMRRELEKLRTRWCPHAPGPKQAAFLALVCLEALYGGAAGGGKSDALLMAALQHVERPSYAALLVRKSYADLSKPGALLDRAAGWLRGTGAKWRDKDKRWTFPSGASLSFGYLENESDKYQYQSAEFQFIGIDELTQFPESQYLFLLSRLRRAAGSDIPIRMRAATNPGNIGHDWVKARFIDEATRQGEFVPAKLDDNDWVDKAEYEATLSKLDETTRRQYRDGLWVRDPGGLIYKYTAARNSVDALPDLLSDELEQWSYIWAMDFGASQAKPTTARAILAYSPQVPEVYLVEAAKKSGMSVTDIAELYKADSLRYPGGFDKVLGDQGGLGAGYLLELQSRHSIPILGVEKQNKAGYRKLMDDDIRAAKFLVLADGNTDWVDEANALEWDDKGLDCKKGQPDHATDCVLYGWREAKHWAYTAPAERPTQQQKIDEVWDRMRAKVEQSRARRPVRIGRA